MSLISVLCRFPGLVKLVTGLVWGRAYRELAGREIEGEYRHAANFNHTIPVTEKLENLRPEFAGSNELCFEILKRIILIRRGKAAEKNWLFVFGAIMHHPRAVFGNLTLRWIISILDTFSDMPCASRYRLAAGQLRSFSLGIRLGLSMGLQSVPDPATRDEPLHFFNKVEIWDGIIHFNYKWGDTYRNLIERVQRDIAGMPPMREAWRGILLRLVLYPPLDAALRQHRDNQRIFDDVTGATGQ